MNKILIITHRSIKYGVGHYSRSINIKDALKRNYNVSIFLLKNKYELKKKTKLFGNLKNYNLIIIDLPKSFILKSKLLNLEKKVLFLDFVHKKKNFFSILTSFKKINKQKIKSGFSFIPLNKKINQINKKKISRTNEIIIFPGSSSKIPEKIKNFYKRNKDKFKFNIISKIKHQKLSKKIKKKFLRNEKFFIKLKSSTNILMQFGVTTYEAISLGIKPIVWLINEKKDRKNEIIFLKKKNLISVFNEQKFSDQKKKKNKKKIIDYFNITKFIQQILKS